MPVRALKNLIVSISGVSLGGGNFVVSPYLIQKPDPLVVALQSTMYKVYMAEINPGLLAALPCHTCVTVLARDAVTQMWRLLWRLHGPEECNYKEIN